MSTKNSSYLNAISKPLVLTIPGSSVVARPTALDGTDFPINAVLKWSGRFQAFYFDY